MNDTSFNKIYRLVYIFIFSFLGLHLSAQHKVDSLADKVIDKVEIEALFPGGEAAWNAYITKAFMTTDVKFRNNDQGICRVRFIVDSHGNISDVEALTMKKSRLAKFAVEVISAGPKWKPAQQNGRFVKAYREQPITLTLYDPPKSK